jgi:hypothetical protein
MDNPTIFQLIAQLTRKAGVPCVLIGGFAVNYYKVTRQTIDLDLMIAKEDFAKVVGPMQEAGFKLAYTENVFARFSGQKNYLMDVDFMFVDKDTIDKIRKEGKELRIGRNSFIVPSLDTVIALKLHAIRYNQKIREFKDMPDIINLIRVNKFNHKTKEFKELCLKYGTEDLYKKIMDGV